MKRGMEMGNGRGVVVGVVLGLMLSVTAASAGERSYWSEAGLGAGAAVSNIGYMPVKFTYAALGAVTGGLTYALTGGSLETAESVWIASLGGTYVIVPEMLTGERSIEFSGTPRLDGSMVAQGPTSVAQESSVIEDDYITDRSY